MKRTDAFNIFLFIFLWIALIMKKENVKEWLLGVTNNQLILGIVIPIILYSGMVLLVRYLKNKY
jgi:hypothetical protein